MANYASYIFQRSVEVRTSENGHIMRIYEFPKTGQVLLIPDPQLKLSQLAEVQDQVAALLK